MIECINAIWTYKYNNGYTVTLRGPLTAHIVVTALPPGHAPSPPSPSSAAAAGGAQGANQPVSNVALKFEEFQFDANMHDKYVSLDSIQGTRNPGGSPGSLVRQQPQPQQQLEDDDKRWEEPRVTIEMGSIPGEPVNAFGIPQATMRCLELAESVSAMKDLISFSREQDIGPIGESRRAGAVPMLC